MNVKRMTYSSLSWAILADTAVLHTHSKHRSNVILAMSDLQLLQTHRWQESEILQKLITLSWSMTLRSCYGSRRQYHLIQHSFRVKYLDLRYKLKHLQSRITLDRLEVYTSAQSKVKVLIKPAPVWKYILPPSPRF